MFSVQQDRWHGFVYTHFYELVRLGIQVYLQQVRVLLQVFTGLFQSLPVQRIYYQLSGNRLR